MWDICLHFMLANIIFHTPFNLEIGLFKLKKIECIYISPCDKILASLHIGQYHFSHTISILAFPYSNHNDCMYISYCNKILAVTSSRPISFFIHHSILIWASSTQNNYMYVYISFCIMILASTLCWPISPLTHKFISILASLK